ncbi:hypothetical protein HAX54_053014, partial [Datura stramonium]|nr:hypothetical protein [Datura stramonium]
MESTLEVVLENVLATEEGVQDLRSKLLDLAATIRSNDVIIQQLEERMNELASQMAAQTIENNMAPMQDFVENNIFEWEIEEEVVGEFIADVLLKGQELEEVHHGKATSNEVKGCTKAFSCLASVWVQGQEANCVIKLATKSYKEDLAMKRAKYARTMTLPSSSASTHTIAAPLHTGATKKALQLAKDKLACLCSTIDVLESKAISVSKNKCSTRNPIIAALLQLQCVRCMMSILPGHPVEWQIIRTMSFAPHRIIGWCKAPGNLYHSHQIHSYLWPNKQLLGCLIPSPSLRSHDPITNSIRKHLSLPYLFFGYIGGN